jgi:protein-S-isoprenylcysteine O-methyltransferase Ste14
MIHQQISDDYVHLIMDGTWIRTHLFDSKKRCFLVVYGIKENGKKELIDFMLPSHENERDWTLFLEWLKKAGLKGSKLETITSDDHFGLGNAIEKNFPGVYHSVDSKTDFSSLNVKLNLIAKSYSFYNPKKLRLVLGWVFAAFFVYQSRTSLPSLLWGSALILIGEWIRVWSAGTLVKTKELTVSGPYAHTRNPLYIGSFFISVGFVVMSQLYSLLPVVTLFYFWVYHGTVFHEEATLLHHYGNAFKTYTQNVPKLFPRLSAFKDDHFESHSFSLQQSYKNGELITFSSICLAVTALMLKQQWLHQSLFSPGSLVTLIAISAALMIAILFQYSIRTKK